MSLYPYRPCPELTQCQTHTMSQESFIYSFVSRGTVILAEYTEFTGNFPAIAAQCLQKVLASNSKFIYNCDGHTFNFLVEDGYGKLIILSFPSISLCFVLVFCFSWKLNYERKWLDLVWNGSFGVGFYFTSKLKHSHMEFCFLGFVYFLVFFEFFSWSLIFCISHMEFCFLGFVYFLDFFEFIFLHMNSVCNS